MTRRAGGCNLPESGAVVSDNDEQKLRNVFQESLGIAAVANFENLAYRETKEWDSVAHMQLVAAIESTFDLMLDTADVIGMSSYPVARTILIRLGVFAG
jgi:acyl carrier protein